MLVSHPLLLMSFTLKNKKLYVSGFEIEAVIFTLDRAQKYSYKIDFSLICY